MFYPAFANVAGSITFTCNSGAYIYSGELTDSMIVNASFARIDPDNRRSGRWAVGSNASDLLKKAADADGEYVTCMAWKANFREDGVDDVVVVWTNKGIATHVGCKAYFRAHHICR